MSRRSWIFLIIVAILGFWAWKTYNGLVDKDEAVNKAWGDVEAAYQRRFDLIPNLVNVVKGYAEHEEKTFKEVTEARNKATQMTISADSLNEETMAKFQEAQAQLQGSLSRLMAITEAYPELKANEEFLKLQSSLEGTENRINEKRKDFNAAVEPYNKAVRRFPANILSGMFGFETKAMFKSEAGAEKSVKVEF